MRYVLEFTAYLVCWFTVLIWFILAARALEWTWPW